MIDEQDISIEIPEDQVEKPVESGEIAEKPARDISKSAESGKIAEKPALDTPDELADLKKQLEAAKQAQQDERKRAQTYEIQAREAAEARKNAESQYADSRIGTISSAIDAEEARATNAQRTYRDAMSQGDFDAASTAQREMAKAEARLLMLTQGKEELETPSRPRTTEGAVRAEPQDPVEALARRLSIASAQWVRAHPEAANDVEALGAAHSAAVHLDKVRVDTPEYFAAVEKHLGMRTPIAAADLPPPAPEPSRRTPSAPVGASASSASRNSGGNIITLTGAERDMARTLFDDKTPAEAERLYAINKAALIKEGAYDKKAG